MQVLYLVLSLFLNTVLASSGSTTAAEPWEPNVFTDSDFALVKPSDGITIRLGDSREQVEKQLGSPIDTIGFLHLYVHEGVKIHYKDGLVNGLLIDDNTENNELFTTARRVSMGDNAANVLIKYGDQGIFNEAYGSLTVSYILEKRNGGYIIIDSFSDAQDTADLFTFSMIFDKEGKLVYILIADHQFTTNPTL
ncbi:hypothetical protein D3C75_700980 [compost metagenome]